MARMVVGVVRQHPPISLAPESRHLVAKTSNFLSSKHFDGCKQRGTKLDKSNNRDHMASTQKVDIEHYFPFLSYTIPCFTTVGVDDNHLFGRLQIQRLTSEFVLIHNIRTRESF